MDGRIWAGPSVVLIAASGCGAEGPAGADPKP